MQLVVTLTFSHNLNFWLMKYQTRMVDSEYLGTYHINNVQDAQAQKKEPYWLVG